MAQGRGREHDFRVFKRSQCSKMHPKTELLGDSGYQGVQNFHPNSHTPHKRSKKKPLTTEHKAHNKALASRRVVAEHIIRKLKVFRIFKEAYRHRRRRFGLRLHLIAGLYNADLDATD